MIRARQEPRRTGQRGIARLTARTLKGFADSPQSESLRLTIESRYQALNRFISGLIAQPEGLVMNGQNVFCSRSVGHFNGLLGIAVVPNPRPISPNWHDADFKRAT